MDAKPARPLRAMRVTDENMAPPAILPHKTLHQRTKSVPALSTLQSAAARVAAVAEANKKILGEANANAKLPQAAKDDSVLIKKFAPIDIIKAVALPLTRPASRPATTKNLLAVVQSNVAKTEPLLQEPAKKLVVKKSTKVLKDCPAPTTAVPLEVQTNVNAVEQPPLPVVVPLHTALTNTEVISQAILPLDHAVVKVEPQPPKVVEPVLTAITVNTNVTKIDTEVALLDPQLNNGVSVLPTMHAPVATYTPVDNHEYFIEDDYTTTRSFGLHTQSVGGLTTILAPEHDSRSQIEIQKAKEFVESTRTEEDIDDEEWDTSMVAEYSEEIFAYMRKLEARMLPNPRYMELQQEIQWSMRAVLIDWVVQVHQRFTLLPETLFLAVNYIDRFLSCKVVSLGKLQLVGATALFIAAKFEEVNCPTLQEVIFMVDGGYTIDELLKAERFMLSMLQFDLGWPGPMSFLRRISKADDYDLETRTLAKYFLEVTMMDERFVGCTPSYLAAGSHCMARLMLRKGEWSTAHVAYSEYTYTELRPLLQGLVECCEYPQKHHLSVYEKYTDKRYKRASVFVEGEMQKGFSLATRALVQSTMDSFLNIRPTAMV